MFFVYSDDDNQVHIFDPENNGADVAAFAEMWPESIYFEMEMSNV